MSKNNKKIIEDIRKLKTDFKYQEQIDEARRLLEVVSEKLYESDVHFVFELIQNADDNKYNTKEPELSFEIIKNELIIKNNEIGFNEDNVRSICTAGNSTKKSQPGFIGEKGIGFKSVFKITDNPQIYSNNFVCQYQLLVRLLYLFALFFVLMKVSLFYSYTSRHD